MGLRLRESSHMYLVIVPGSVDGDDGAAGLLLVLPSAVRAGVAVQVVGAAVRLALPGDTGTQFNRTNLGIHLGLYKFLEFLFKDSLR